MIAEFWKYADRRLDRAFEISLSEHETVKNDLSYLGKVEESDRDRQRQIKMRIMQIEAQRHYEGIENE